MSLPPLFEVRRIYYPALMVLSNVSYSEKKFVVPQLSVTSKMGKMPRKRDLWVVRLDIKTPDGLDPATFPYIFALSVCGYFLCSMPAKIEKEAYLLKRKLFYVNGSTLLYSAARDRLLLLTGNNLHPPYCLPAHRFDPEDI